MPETRPETYPLNGGFARQPIGEFFVGIMPSKILCKIAYSEIRRLVDREVETYSGLNRPISPQRIKEIREYIGSVDATFPNSIIIAVSSEDILEQTNSSITLQVHGDVAKIIDGQHRLKGLEETNPADFDVVVSVFIDMDVEDQAMVFSTINLKQTKVSKSLVYDLFELTSHRSPQKTCHDVAKALNADSESPLYRRIKLLGRNPKLDDEVLYRAPLTQAAFVKYLLPMISDNPDRDRNLIKSGEQVTCAKEAGAKGQVFCKYFANKEDWTIVRILTNYFNAVKTMFPLEWDDLENPLSKTIGYGALMRLLRNDLFLEADRAQDFSVEFFKQYLQKARGLEFRFAPEGKYSPAGKGETDLYNDLKIAINE